MVGEAQFGQSQRKGSMDMCEITDKSEEEVGRVIRKGRSSFWVWEVDQRVIRVFFIQGLAGTGEREREIEGFSYQKPDTTFCFSYRVGFFDGLTGFTQNQKLI